LKASLSVLGASALSAFLASGCLGGIPIYAPCEDGVDCEAPATGCYELLISRSDGADAAGTFCSRDCVSNDDCAPGGACLALAADPDGRFICMSLCAEAADCYDGLRCTSVDGLSGADVCLP